MDDAERERLYRDAMRQRRAGEVCPLCGSYHSAASTCPATPADAEPPPGARTSDVETSHAAAASGDKRALRFIVLGLYVRHPLGLVDDDLAIYAGYSEGHESYRRRGSDLRALGWTEWLMERVPDPIGSTWDGMIEQPVRRQTSLGSTARVSVITELGHKVWADYGRAA